MLSRLQRLSRCSGPLQNSSQTLRFFTSQGKQTPLRLGRFSMSAPQDEAMADPPATAPAPTAPSEQPPSATTTTSSKQLLAQPTDPSAPPMSKNALKRLRKAQEWEDGKEERRAHKREKRQGRRVRQREEKAALLASGVDRSIVYPKRPPSVLVPVSLVLDCDFEKYMTDRERVSLGSQVTRSYSENKTAKWKIHLWVAGWGGKLLERFEGPMDRQHEQWKGVGFCTGDFAQTALEAGQGMKEEGGEMIESLKRSVETGVDWERDARDPFPIPGPEPEPNEEYKDMIYLSSDSPYTIARLEPNKSYIIGGLVDKNREKGLCYRRARARGIRTAKLPIGQYMAMSTRQVLATNHVVEIMLKWLEFEDWGKAFEAVIPKRKGGVLLSHERAEDGDEAEDGDLVEEETDDVEPEAGETPAEPEEGAAETSQTELSQQATASNAEGS